MTRNRRTQAQVERLLDNAAYFARTYPTLAHPGLLAKFTGLVPAAIIKMAEVEQLPLLDYGRSAKFSIDGEILSYLLGAEYPNQLLDALKGLSYGEEVGTVQVESFQ